MQLLSIIVLLSITIPLSPYKKCPEEPRHMGNSEEQRKLTKMILGYSMVEVSESATEIPTPF
jgi:hypothetical protein